MRLPPISTRTDTLFPDPTPFRSKSWRVRLAWLAVGALCAAFMVRSGSRGPLLALCAALVCGLAVADRRLAGAVIALMAAGVAVGLLADMRSIELLYERAPSGHFAIWQQALTAIAERPWLGYGSLADIEFATRSEEHTSELQSLMRISYAVFCLK